MTRTICIVILFIWTGAVVFGQPERNLSVSEIEEILWSNNSNGFYIELIEALDHRGYIVTQISKTLLNRLKITAVNDVHEREIVASQMTGRILRDGVTRTFSNNGNDFLVAPLVPLVDLLRNDEDGIKIVPVR